VTREPAVTSKIMRAVRGTGTGPEMRLRRALHALGFRYRVRNRLPGRPDLVFTGARVAVFVDGDRWHGNGWRARGMESPEEEFQHANGPWWREKIERNVARDRRVDAELHATGWTVVRVWASDLDRDLQAAVERVLGAVRGRGHTPSRTS